MNSDTYTLSLQCTDCGHIWDDTFPISTLARRVLKHCPHCAAGGLPGGLTSPIRNLGRPRRPEGCRPKGDVTWESA